MPATPKVWFDRCVGAECNSALPGTAWSGGW